MKRVLDDIITKALPDGKKYLLLDDFKYHVGSDNSNEIIVVPNGFVTDFASVPRFAWSIVPPTGKIKPAALVHDYLYSKRGKYAPNQRYTRKKCDKIFLEIMNVVGMNWFERHTAYRAVRMFGWIPW